MCFWKLMLKCLIMRLQGVGVMSWMVPGGSKIAVAYGVVANEAFLA